MPIRSTALQSALAGMTAAHNRLAAAAQNLANPFFASASELSSAESADKPSADSQASTTQSMSADIGGSLISLHESLAQARTSSATAGAARAMFEELLAIGRR